MSKLSFLGSWLRRVSGASAPVRPKVRRRAFRPALEGLEERITLSTYYVDNTNPNSSNSGPGTSARPFSTISHAALRASQPGDTVIVVAGTYAEDVRAQNYSGTASAPITFTTAPGATVIISGQAHGFKVLGQSWIVIHGFTITQTVDGAIDVLNSSNITVDGNDVSFAGQPVAGQSARGITLDASTNSVVSHNTVHDNSNSGISVVNGSTGIQIVNNIVYNNAAKFSSLARGIVINNNSGGNTIAGNISHDNEEAGIQLLAGNNLIFNNVCYNDGDHGIDVVHAPANIIIDNSIYNNVNSGINIEGGSTGNTLANNISVDNSLNAPNAKGDIRVEADSVTGTTIDYDLVFEHQPHKDLFTWAGLPYRSLAAFQAATGQETHGIVADPLWVSPSTGNFHLQEGSPAIDAANSGVIDQPSYDADGNPRVDDPLAAEVGVGPRDYDDRGAYEYQATPITITGQVFQDSNGNGVRDLGESPLSGWTVQLQSGGTVAASATTDANGNYSFTNVDPGTYQLREVLQSGWTQTTTNPADITVSTGGTTSNVNFGLFQNIAISGQVFQDSNGNGVQDTGEPGLAGWTVFLDTDGNGVLDPGEVSTTTDSNGNFSFSNLGPGTYPVRALLPAGWIQTTTNPAAIIASSGGNVTRVSFGNFQNITISGQVFQDTNANGTPDPGEPGLGGWTVFLDANGNGVLDPGETSTTTDSNGDYSFTNLGPGTYRVRVALPNNWSQTSTNPADIAASSGSSVANVNFGVFFGVFQGGTISGTVFLDYNADGLQEPGEPGRPGAIVYLDTNNNGMLDAGEATAITDSNGHYTLGGLTFGTYTVRQAALPSDNDGDPSPSDTDGLVQTSPAGKSYSVVITNAIPVTGKNFGNVIVSPVAPPVVTASIFPAGAADANTAFVQGLYHSLLNRNADPSGLNQWLKRLVSGVSRDTVARGIWESAEHRGLEVDSYYQSFLHRQPGAAERAAWIGVFQGGASETDVILGFVTSAEYQAAHSSNAAFVNELYADTLGRLADADGLASWLNALQNGASRSDVARGIITARESVLRATDAFYAAYLHRAADSGGESNWLTSGLSLENIGLGILSSGEYFSDAAAAR